MANHKHPQNQNKNLRQPICDGQERSDQTKVSRRRIGPQKRMDMQAYVDNYQKYDDNGNPMLEFCVINDIDGNVQRWLDAGAEPIPARISGRKIYPGLNDNAPSEWVRFVAGETKDGRVLYAYGLMMDKELYYDFKHAPVVERKEEVKKALQRGKSQANEDNKLPSGNAVETYAANLPGGRGQGFNQIRKS